MDKDQAQVMKELLVLFEETASRLKDVFTYVDSKFELKNDELHILFRADNEPR